MALFSCDIVPFYQIASVNRLVRPLSFSRMKTESLRTVFRWLHFIWGFIGVSICILLATAKGGHPPGLVFVPVAAVIWLAGHILLWVSRKLAIRGKALVENRKNASGNWPLILIILAFVSGLVFIFGLFGIIWRILDNENWLRYMTLPLSIWLLCTSCFFGFLLRKDWSRILAGSGSIFLGVILLYEMIASLLRGYRNSNTEWIMAIFIFLLLITLGLYIFRSKRIKEFFYK